MSARTVTVTSTDLPTDVLALTVVTLTVFASYTTVSRRIAGTLSTLALTSSEAGKIGRSLTLLHAALQRQRAGQRMLTLLPGPSLFTVTRAAITLAMTCAVAVRVSVVGLVTGPLIAFTGVSVNISPVARGIYIVTVTLPTHTGPSVAADFPIWSLASPLAFPWADVTLEFTFVSMPTRSTVTVSTVTLAMASTHLSGILVQTLAVVTLTETSSHQTPVVLIVTHAAPTVASASVGAHHSLWVFAKRFALLAG